MPPYTPYKTLDEVKEAIDKFDECCLDLLDVLDKLKPAGIDPKSLNPLASEIHSSLQRIAPQARARIELTKERKKDLRYVDLRDPSVGVGLIGDLNLVVLSNMYCRKIGHSYVGGIRRLCTFSLALVKECH